MLAEYVLDEATLFYQPFYWQDRTDGGFGTQGWGDLELYDPLYGDACDYAYQDVGTVTDHPMTEGIDELNCYFRGGPTILRDDATAVAWWSDGDPLIAYNQPGGVITASHYFLHMEPIQVSVVIFMSYSQMQYTGQQMHHQDGYPLI